MFKKVLISKLDNLIGEFNTPYYNYLLYSYDLSPKTCESIINQIKNDITNDKVINDNLFFLIDSYFKNHINNQEKESKIKYLDDLLNGEFFDKFLKKYDLSSNEISIIYDKIRNSILKDNISDFEIKRSLKYYFLNAVKQSTYLKNINFIVGRNYDTLTIKKVKIQYPNLLKEDIIEIVNKIKIQIIDAVDFKNGVKNAFFSECMKVSESKKADARSNLNEFVEGSGDSFFKLLKFKKLTTKQGEFIVNNIKDEINNGLIQPDEVNGVFITNKINEYIENETE